MPYQILPNLIFILSVLGILALILRRLPEASELHRQEERLPVEARLQSKGLPAAAVSGSKTAALFLGKKVWNFMLEAKDIKPTAAAGYRIKKLFGARFKPHNPKPAEAQTPVETSPAPTAVKDENYYLDAIKKNPKNLVNYDALGRYYIEAGLAVDARDIYQYLTRHQPGNADFHARLAYCFYMLKDFAKTADHYRKSLTLDSTQPNRYYNLGLVLEVLGKNQEAATALSQAIALEPSNAKFYVSLSSAYQKIGQPEKAQAAIDKARQLEEQKQKMSV